MTWGRDLRLDDPEGLAAGTLVHALEARAAASPDEHFASFDERPPLTPSALLRLVRRFAAGLERYGIGPGDRVLLSLESSPEFVVTWLGLGWRGAVMVPVVPRSGLRAFRRALELTEPRLAIVDAEAAGKLEVDSAVEGPVIEVDDRRPGELCPVFEARLLEERETEEANGARGQELAAILFTSGTTGPAKGVCLAHLWYVWASLDVAAAMRYGPGDRLYTCLPLGHANAQDTSFGPALLSGACIAFDREFHASRFWARLAETGATAFNLIGNMPEILLSRPTEEFVPHRARRAFSVPALPHQYEPFRERLAVWLVEGYGSTEIGVPVFQDLDSPRPGACGRAMPPTLLQIEREDGLPAAPGERGQICAWSPRLGAVTAGYWRDDAASARAWSGGWFRTGDLGWLDDEGYLHFAGRLTDSLRLKGENLSAFELEAALLELEEVAECAVLGRRRSDGDDDVVAYVVPAAGAEPSLDRLTDHCRSALGPHAAPTELRLLEELPHTESGKVAKGTLRQELEREQAPAAPTGRSGRSCFQEGD